MRVLSRLCSANKQFISPDNILQFVPKHNAVAQSEIELLEKFLDRRSNVLVLTGAGISTESGKYMFHLY